jgi:hypothetical protein
MSVQHVIFYDDIIRIQVNVRKHMLTQVTRTDGTSTMDEYKMIAHFLINRGLC